MKSKLDEAQDFLKGQLAEGPLSFEEIRQRTEAAGISPRTLRRAKALQGVVSRKLGLPPSGWQWAIAEGLDGWEVEP